MNKIILLGRLTDPEVRVTTGDNPTTVARYQLAVKRKFAKEGQANADFIRCVAFGKYADFTEKYLRKGMKIVISGRLQTGSYTNEEGQKVYTADVVVEEQEFAESKAVNDEYASGSSRNTQSAQTQETGDGFMEIPENTEGLPFN